MKKQTLRKLLSYLLVVTMVLSLAACGAAPASSAPAPAPAAPAPAPSAEPASPAAPAPAAPKERTKLQVMSWWDITKKGSLQQLKSEFEAANPDIELEFTMIASKYGDKIVTLLAGGGEVPDVMMLAMDLVPKFAKAGQILPLDKYITKEYKDSLYPMVLDALTVDGQVYAAARDVSSKGVYLNTDLFKAAGVPIPSPDWTVEEFIEVGKKLTKTDASGKPEQWGYYFPKYVDNMYDWMLLDGARFTTPDGTKSLMGSPEAKTTLQFMNDLVHVHKICPTEEQAKLYGDKQSSAFQAGKVAMQVAALSMADGLIGNNPPINFTVLPLPKKNGKNPSQAFVNSWTIPAKAKNPELSWRVVEFFSGKQGQQIALDNNM
ncbi:MAG: sugar ABC transporter substrate-binding protein, partial [Angelakisella sp.]